MIAIRILFVFCVSLVGVARLSALEVAPLRYSVDAAPGAFVPYAASHSLTETNREITRIVFAIHSSGFDAMQYYDNAREAASRVPGVLPKTLIIAPQFFEQNVVPGDVPDGLLFWRVSPYRGSGRGAVGPDVKHVGLSAYAVVDEWLGKLASGDTFPRLSEIVIVGHSAGGQFVQRYAMVGKFRPSQRMQMRYVVSAPSSYAYTSKERYHSVQRRFVVPSGQAFENCRGYNDWGYGLDAPYGYFAKDDLDEIARDFADKKVFYLCGSKDTDPNDKSIGRSCGAMMQGMHRLQRMQIYSAFLEFKYGRAVLRNHRFAVVQGVGHYGRGTMTSAAGLKALFAPIR